MSHLFIFGEQRTGSTLIHTLLRKHPQITATPNDFNLVYLYKKGLKIFPHNKDLIKFIKWGLGDLFSLSIKLKTFDRSEIIRYVINAYFNKQEEPIKVHKTPKGEHDLEYYREAFDDVLFLYTIRNPLGILSSRKYWDLTGGWKKVKKSKASFREVREAFEILRLVFNRMCNSIKIIDENYWSGDTLGLILYEQFVSDPIPILKNIFRRLGIEHNEKIFKNLLNISGPYTSYKEFSNKKGIYTNSVDKWKYMLTDLEKNVIYNEFKKFTKDYTFKNKELEKIMKGYL